MKNFDYISVRDKNSFSIVERLLERKPLYHLDPVLAYDYLKCCPLLSQVKKKEKYLLLYAYSGRIKENENKWIKQYAKERQLKIYAIGGVHQCSDKFINCSPFQIFSYFQNADEVITDTFHGTIFSIITHRKFATIVRESKENEYGNEEKLIDLLERLELKDRIINNIVDIEKINSRDIQYKKVDEIITAERQRTQSYIKEILM